MQSAFTTNEICCIAQNQRAMLWAILFSLLNNIVMFLGLFPPTVSGIISLVIFVGVVVVFVKLRNALKANLILTILAIIFMILPLLALLILLYNNQTATKRLKEAGLKVGLMGVSSIDLQKFAAASGEK